MSEPRCLGATGGRVEDTDELARGAAESRIRSDAVACLSRLLLLLAKKYPCWRV